MRQGGTHDAQHENYVQCTKEKFRCTAQIYVQCAREKLRCTMQKPCPMCWEKTFFNGSGISASCQIDETLIGKKRKYNKGKYYPQTWLFGISQPSQHKCLIKPVIRRDEKTLMKIITEHVESSSDMKIVSDGWAAYSKLQEAGVKHSVVIHKEEFKNKEGDTTNSIESIWSQLKTWIARMHGIDQNYLEEYISEFTLRYNYCGTSTGNCLTQFLDIIKHENFE